MILHDLRQQSSISRLLVVNSRLLGICIFELALPRRIYIYIFPLAPYIFALALRIYIHLLVLTRAFAFNSCVPLACTANNSYLHLLVDM